MRKTGSGYDVRAIGREHTLASPSVIRLVPGDDLAILIDDFIGDCELGELSEQTITSYRNVLRRFHWWCIHDGAPLQPERHTAQHMRAFLRYLQQPERWGGTRTASRRPLKASSRHTYQRILIIFYNWLVKQGFIEENPFKKLPRPKVSTGSPVSPFTSEEVERLLAEASRHEDPNLGLRNHAIVSLLLDTGLRNSDVRNLTLDDVEVSTGEVIVQRSKGGKGRSVYMGIACRRSVRRYALQVRYRNEDTPNQFFFLSVRERQLSYGGLRELLLRIGERAGVEGVHPHRFRHTFAVNAVRAGMPLFQLQLMLGHNSLEMVRYYVELARTDVADAARSHSPLDWMRREG